MSVTQQPGTTMHVIVMGVSGCGKTTVGKSLAERTGWRFAEGDDFHPKANIDKMAVGVPLEDDDRWPWLEDIAAWVRSHANRGHNTIVTCSALKRSYRDLLIQEMPWMGFVHLHGTLEVLTDRMKHRSGHFMPVSLLTSQIDTLESLAVDECGIVIDIDAPVDTIVDQAMSWLDTQIY